MPVEFLLKPKDTKLGVQEEFQLENVLFDRIRDLRDAFNDLFIEAISHTNFKEYVERMVYVLKQIDHKYDELVEKSIHAKFRLNGAE